MTPICTLRILCCMLVLGAGLHTPTPAAPPEEGAEKNQPESVTVAALQFHSVFGAPESNRRRLVPLIRKAAEAGANIVVLPEAAVPGYCDLSTDRFWSKEKKDSRFANVKKAAETIPGVSTRFFSPWAKKLKIYLTVPVIERKDGKFYNAVALLGPRGKIRLIHRKVVPWTLADTHWMTTAPADSVKTVSTEYGRIGIMICRDVHKLLPVFGKKGVNVALHCVAWYGPNSGGWFDHVLSRKIKQAGVHLVLANWTFPKDPGWSGHGFSRIVNQEGKKVAEARNKPGSRIILGKLPLGVKSGPSNGPHKKNSVRAPEAVVPERP